MERPQFDLFGGGTPRVGAAPHEDVSHVAREVPRSIFIGTSSWSFPGWSGIVYDDTYTEALLAREGLRAYSQHPLLRAAGIDRSYYAPLDAQTYANYAAQVPDDFRFLVKAERLSVLPIVEDARGQPTRNARFLDPEYATETFVRPVLAGLAEKAGPLLFQFSPLPARVFGGAREFVERLSEFLTALPQGPLYAVELRTPELFTPNYAKALSRAAAVHGFTVHGSMVPLADQLRAIPAATQRAFVLRWMLHPRFAYQEARAAYAPFNRIVDADEDTRRQIVQAALAAADENRDAYVIINNKAEGSSPLSAFALAERVAGAARRT